MDKQKCRLLIDLYKGHRSLWDSRHRNYHNSTVREESWNEISSILNVPVAEIKSRMRILMSTYRREKSRQKQSQVSGSGRDKVYVSKWFAFECFKFLYDRDKPHQAAEINTEEADEVPASKQEETHASQTTESSDGILASSPSTSVKRSSASSNHVKRRKCIATNSTSEDSVLEKAATLLQKGPEYSTDAYFTYGQYIANELRKYDARTLTFVKQAINNIIFEGDMGRMSSPNYEYPEVQYPTPESNYTSTPSSARVSTSLSTPNFSQACTQPPQH